MFLECRLPKPSCLPGEGNGVPVRKTKPLKRSTPPFLCSPPLDSSCVLPNLLSHEKSFPFFGYLVPRLFFQRLIFRKISELRDVFVSPSPLSNVFAHIFPSPRLPFFVCFFCSVFLHESRKSFHSSLLAKFFSREWTPGTRKPSAGG